MTYLNNMLSQGSGVQNGTYDQHIIAISVLHTRPGPRIQNCIYGTGHFNFENLTKYLQAEIKDMTMTKLSEFNFKFHHNIVPCGRINQAYVI